MNFLDYIEAFFFTSSTICGRKLYQVNVNVGNTQRDLISLCPLLKLIRIGAFFCPLPIYSLILKALYMNNCIKRSNISWCTISHYSVLRVFKYFLMLAVISLVYIFQDQVYHCRILRPVRFLYFCSSTHKTIYCL